MGLLFMPNQTRQMHFILLQHEHYK